MTRDDVDRRIRELLAEWYSLTLYIERQSPFPRGAAVSRKLELERLLDEAWEDIEKNWTEQ